MTTVERIGDQFIVDAATLSKAFDLPPEEIRSRMQKGQITSQCEAGEGTDAGRWRLTFRHQGRAFRLIVDTHGEVLRKTTFPVGPSIATPPTKSAIDVPSGRKKS